MFELNKQDYLKICDEWLNDFMSFYNWSMENSYKEDLTIDRINNNGNYEPSNCRWTTIKKQSNNRRTNRFITYKGETKSLTELSEEYNINASTFSDRLERGWTLEQALTISTKGTHRKLNKGVYPSGLRSMTANHVTTVQIC